MLILSRSKLIISLPTLQQATNYSIGGQSIKQWVCKINQENQEITKLIVLNQNKYAVGFIIHPIEQKNKPNILMIKLYKKYWKNIIRKEEIIKKVEKFNFLT